jgi:hypothetical protein
MNGEMVAASLLSAWVASGLYMWVESVRARRPRTLMQWATMIMLIMPLILAGPMTIIALWLAMASVRR